MSRITSTQTAIRTAYYSTMCGICNKWISKGDQISVSPLTSNWVHFGCANPFGCANNKPITIEEIQVEDNHKDTQSQDPMAVMARAIAPHLKSHLNLGFDSEKLHDAIAGLDEKLKTQVVNSLEGLNAVIEQQVQKYCTHTVLLQRPDLPDVEIKDAHHMMPKLLYLVERRLWAYLHGPSQSGKSTAAQHVADAIGLPFEMVSLNVGTFEHKLFGFIDANGEYHSTGLRKCWESGGVFLIDEADNASANLLTSLNSLLAQDIYSFPDQMVKKHKDFVCIATGNTAGRGGNRQHSDRRAFDAAFMNRFAYLQWGYDRALERKLASQYFAESDQWVDWIQAVRDYCQTRYPQIQATMRASFEGAQMLADKIFTTDEITDALVFKGIDSETRRAILNECPAPYFERD